MPVPSAGLVVAIDGPSGSGKSSVARGAAAALGLPFLDTGAMYRAVTWAALEQGVDLADEEAVAALARGLDLRLGTDPAAPRVGVGRTDVTAAVRETRISEAVSAVATNLAVRAELVRRAQELIAAAVRRSGGVVAEGRDVTTVIAPEAAVRLLLTASPATRVARRARDVHGRADASAVAATAAQVVERDARDATVVEFQRPADGVAVLDSSDLDLPQTVAAVLAEVERRTGVRPR